VGTGVLVGGKEVSRLREEMKEKNVLPTVSRSAHRVIITSVRQVNSIAIGNRRLGGFDGLGKGAGVG
jgi:hypothetical protein